MSKPIKELVTTELRSRYGALDSALWIELQGVDGTTTNQFRRDLRTRRMRMEVVKTSMLRRALGESSPLAPLARVLSGPAALLTGGESLIDVARAVEEWSPKLKTLKLRGAVLEGEFIDEQRVQQLSKMPGKRDLQGMIAAAARAPGAKLAAAVLSGGARIAGCLKALIEKLEKGESAAPAA